MRLTSTTLLLVALLAAPPAAAIELSSNEIFIPIIGRVPGGHGTQWRTDVMISNRHEHLSTTVTVVYDDVARVPIQSSFELNPRQSITLHDVLLEQFGLEQASGTLWLGADNIMVRINASARIYNVGNTAGEFGQLVQGLPIGTLSKRPWLSGLTGVNGNRTNVGVANPNSMPAFFGISWFDKTGEQRGAQSGFEVAPWSVVQWSDIFQMIGFPHDEGLTLRINSNVPIYAYASVVRNDTGDAYTIIGDGHDD